MNDAITKTLHADTANEVSARLDRAKDSHTAAERLYAEAMRNLPFRVLQWRIVVWPLPVEEQTEGGIYIPDEVRETDEFKATCGLLVGMGANAFKAVTKNELRLDEEANPALGSWVLFPEYAGSLMVVNGTDAAGQRREVKYRVMNDTDIIAVTDKPGAFRRR